jgi:hypothetical protein
MRRTLPREGRLGKAREEEMFFFEKKNQKAFITWAYLARLARDSIAKVFCFFFQNRRPLFLLDGAVKRVRIADN